MRGVRLVKCEVLEVELEEVEVVMRQRLPVYQS